jgi:hypothetical protein
MKSRIVFAAYLLFVVLGLVYCVTVGILHR